MGDWGGYQRDSFHQERRRKSNYKKPPSGSWHPSVPSWEKEFCSSLCLIPWRKLCETKRVMSLYKNIVQWDDSAGEEAFKNAKTRFWAKRNGLPCDISLPDPDIYIDDVDWNSYIDPELLSDLDKISHIPDDGDKSGNPGILNSTLSNQPILCSGWDDLDDPVMENNKPVDSGWGNYEGNTDSMENKVIEDNSWGSGWGDSNKKANNNAWEESDTDKKLAMKSSWGGGWEQWNSNKNSDNNNVVDFNSWEQECGWGGCNNSGNNFNSSESKARKNRVENNLCEVGWRQWDGGFKDNVNSAPRENHGDWRTGTGYSSRKRGGGVRYVPRHNDYNSRFQGDYCQMNGWSRNDRGRKRVSFAYERPIIT